MANITLGAGAQDFLYERNGENDAIIDFRSRYFQASLDEAQEVPPNDDIEGIEGSGAGSLNFAETRFEFTIEIEGIDLAGGEDPDDMIDAHIHGAEFGAAGPIIFDFLNDSETDVDAEAGTITGGWDVDEEDALDLTSDSLANLLSEDTYFNIHTNRDTAGFIRGQILRDGGVRDQIDLTDVNIGSFATLKAVTADRDDGARIRTFLDGEASRLQLDGVAESDLRASHFIFAGSVAETIEGTGERDDLFGAGGRDTLIGRGGGDRLFGENGRDELSGGGGGDTLVGGRGRDALTGGARADNFVFDRIADTGDSRRTADRITDFVADVDLLDLEGIDADRATSGDQAFTFIGDEVFNASGQVRVIEAGNGDTLVLLNTTGQGGVEAVLRLTNEVALSEDSFVL